MRLPALARKKQTLKRKLFGYMILLAVLLLILLISGTYLIGGFTNTKKRVADTLEFQAEIFERQIDTYYDALAVMSIQLSDNTAWVIDSYLSENEIAFDDLNGSQAHIEQLQEQIIVPLNHKLWEADCTGAFVILEAKVNLAIQDAEFSRSGIYLQRNSLEASDDRVLLYRGLSQVGKENDCMPHRKWRLEFDTRSFPSYSELTQTAELPLKSAYRLSDVVILPGTDQYVMLMTMPIFGADGTFYGLCGFEINEGYFRQRFAQPSELDRAVFCLSKSNVGGILGGETLSAGVLNSYYLQPSGDFEVSDFGNGLTEFIGDDQSYIGLTKDIRLCPGECTSSIGVLMPREDYMQMQADDILRVTLLIVILVLIATGLSYAFAHRYLKPIKHGIEQIKRKEYHRGFRSIDEINDLFAFLARQDRQNEEMLEKVKQEQADTLSSFEQLQSKYDDASKQVERLAYSRKDEVDPYDYENFKAGIKTLTAKEKEVLDLYIAGNTVKEIIAILQLQESTVRFHNKNIYSKLGVHSLKQLLRCVAILRHEEQQASERALLEDVRDFPAQ